MDDFSDILPVWTVPEMIDMRNKTIVGILRETKKQFDAEGYKIKCEVKSDFASKSSNTYISKFYLKGDSFSYLLIEVSRDIKTEFPANIYFGQSGTSGKTVKDIDQFVNILKNFFHSDAFNRIMSTLNY